MQVRGHRANGPAASELLMALISVIFLVCDAEKERMCFVCGAVHAAT